VAEVAAKEGGDAAGGGEHGDVGVEIEAVDALQLEEDVIFLEGGDVRW
jgi:hypothetical protein